MIMFAFRFRLCMFGEVRLQKHFPLLFHISKTRLDRQRIFENNGAS